MNIAIFSSSRGTTFQAFIDAGKSGKMSGVEIKLLLTDRECLAMEKAKAAGIPVVFLDPMTKDGGKLEREAYDRQIAELMKSYHIDLIVLAGWMRILSPWFVQQFPKKITNVHPSLLPQHSGLMDMEVHRAVIAAGEKESGMTVHFVDEKVDHGEIILQKKVAVAPDETPETLKEKVLALEKDWYPRVIVQILPLQTFLHVVDYNRNDFLN